MIKKYIDSLHTRSEHHVRRFSMIVSGCFTLLIFGLWLAFKLGPNPVLAGATQPVVPPPAESPFQSLKANASEAWALLTGEVGKAKSGLQSVDLQNNYTQLRDDALNNR